MRLNRCSLGQDYLKSVCLRGLSPFLVVSLYEFPEALIRFVGVLCGEDAVSVAAQGETMIVDQEAFPSKGSSVT